MDIDLFKEQRYKKTKGTNWTMHTNGRPGRVIHPILFTGPAEVFCPNISDKELKGMVDVHGNVRNRTEQLRKLGNVLFLPRPF